MSRNHPLPTDAATAESNPSQPLAGASQGTWPALTMYRFPHPGQWMRSQVQPLTLVILAQGRHELEVRGSAQAHRAVEYLVLGSHVHVTAEVLEASARRPYLSVVLEIDPRLVRRVATDMKWGTSGAGTSRSEGRSGNATCAQDLLGMVLRARDNIRSDLDRHILAPLYLQEIVYRLLQSEQRSLLLNLAASESASSAASTVIEYARGHMADTLTVADMADLVNLSPSAFAHQFRETTGRPPYQFVKEMRLDHARDLLVGSNLTVARISKEVGYASVSHFISAFRGRFGLTPHAYSTHALHRSQGRVSRPPATLDLPRQRARM